MLKVFCLRFQKVFHVDFSKQSCSVSSFLVDCRAIVLRNLHVLCIGYEHGGSLCLQEQIDSLWWEQDAVTGSRILAICTKDNFSVLLTTRWNGIPIWRSGSRGNQRAVSAEVQYLPQNTQAVLLSCFHEGAPAQQSALIALPEAGWHRVLLHGNRFLSSIFNSTKHVQN